MYKDKEAKGIYQKEYMRAKRSNKLKEKGLTNAGTTTIGSNILEESSNITHKRSNISASERSILEKLVDPSWRYLLEYLVHNVRPEWHDNILLGASIRLSSIAKMLEATGGKAT